MLSIFSRASASASAPVTSLSPARGRSSFRSPDAKSTLSTTEEDSLSVSSTVEHNSEKLEPTQTVKSLASSKSTCSDQDEDELSNEQSIFAWDAHGGHADDSPLTEFKFNQQKSLPFLSEPTSDNEEFNAFLANTVPSSSDTVLSVNTRFCVDFTSFLEKLEKGHNGELTTLSQQMMVLIARHFHNSIQILKSENNSEKQEQEQEQEGRSGSRVLCNIDLESQPYIVETVKSFLLESNNVLSNRDDLSEALRNLFPSILVPNLQNLNLNLKEPEAEVEREGFSFEVSEQENQGLAFQLSNFQNHGLSAINSFHTLPSSFYLGNQPLNLNALIAQSAHSYETTPTSQSFEANLQFPNQLLFNNALNTLNAQANTLTTLYNNNNNNNNNNNSSFNYAQNSLLNQNSFPIYENSHFQQDGNNTLEEKIFGLCGQRRKRKIKVNKNVSNFLLQESKKRQFKLPKSLKDVTLHEDAKHMKKKVKGKQRGRPRKFKTNSVSNSLFSLSGSLTSNVNNSETLVYDTNNNNNNNNNNFQLLNGSENEENISAFQSENNISINNNKNDEEWVPSKTEGFEMTEKAFSTQTLFSAPNVLIVKKNNLKSKTNVERSKEENDLINLGLAAIEEKILILQQNIRAVKHKHRKGTICPSCTYEQKLRLCVKAKVRILDTLKQTH